MACPPVPGTIVHAYTLRGKLPVAQRLGASSVGLAGPGAGDGEVAAYQLFVSVVCTTIPDPATVGSRQTEDSLAPMGFTPARFCCMAFEPLTLPDRSEVLQAEGTVRSSLKCDVPCVGEADSGRARSGAGDGWHVARATPGPGFEWAGMGSCSAGRCFNGSARADVRGIGLSEPCGARALHVLYSRIERSDFLRNGEQE